MDPKLSPVRLHGTHELFGRRAELAQLDAAWASEGATRVVTIIGWGGEGKTALVSHWRTQLLARPAGELEAVYDLEAVYEWSFYSQGSHDHNAASADVFFRDALVFFDEPALADSPAPQRVKAQRLAERIAARRALLILDGLEPLQHPPDAAGAGALKEDGMVVLLQALARQNRGLCLVTSRAHVRELDEAGAACVELGQLDVDTGAALLQSQLEGGSRSLAVVPSTEKERREIVEAMQGHALSVLLIGSYVRRALGDVRRWREIDLHEADATMQRGRVWAVMEAYVRWLSGAGPSDAREQARVTATYGEGASEGQMQLAVLRMLGLFDRTADPGCIAALLEPPVIPGLTEGLVGLSRTRWRALLSSLQDARLLAVAKHEPVAVFGYDEATARAAGEKWQPEGEPQRWPLAEHGSEALVLDAHPVVREYFGEKLQRTNEAAWRDGHRRLYEYLCASVPYWPDGVTGLQPLYQALVHGCAAGRVQEALDAVYHDRILRGARYYSTAQLGAFGAELGALANFFEHVWDRPARELAPDDRSWLLGQAAFCLRGVGRLSEALEPMRASFDMAVALEDWTSAAPSASNLSDLELTLGRIESAVADATQAVAHAERSEDEFLRLAMRTTLANARLTAGELAGARELFEQAEVMQAQRRLSMSELSSLGGHRYCDLLLCPAERAAWRASAQHEPPEPELSTSCRAVFERAKRALAVAIRHRWTLSIALDHLTLGRAALYATRLPAPTLTHAHAREHLEAAVDTLRKAGDHMYIPKGLLTRAWLYHLDNRPDLAHADLDEAMSIAERGPMPLHQADIHLHRARLFHDRTALTAAATLIHKHGYHRRLPELEAAQRDSAHWPAPTPDPTPRPNEIPPMTPNPPPWDPTLRPDLAILIALPEESRSLAAEYAQLWHARPNPHHPGSDFLFVGPHGYRCIATIMPRMGPTVASQTSLRLLAWRPATIVNIGIAGGFKDDLRIGDVIVPRQVDAYAETGKIQGMQWEPRGSSYRERRSARHRARARVHASCCPQAMGR